MAGMPKGTATPLLEYDSSLQPRPPGCCDRLSQLCGRWSDERAWAETLKAEFRQKYSMDVSYECFMTTDAMEITVKHDAGELTLTVVGAMVGAVVKAKLHEATHPALAAQPLP